MTNNRDKKQAEIVSKIQEQGYHGYFKASMRSGKTRILGKVIQTLPFSYNVLYITNTVISRDIDIPKEFKEIGVEHNVDIICYRSTNKLLKSEKVYSLIILDEFQALTAANFSHILPRYRKGAKILACSGTVPNRTSKKILYSALGLNEIISFSTEEAIELGIVAPFMVNILRFELERVDKTVTVSYKNKKTGESKSFKTTEHERYWFLHNRIDTLRDQGRNDKFLNLQRLRFLGSLKIRERIASRMIFDRANTRMLIFCSSIDQAERLCPNTHHSKTTNVDYELFQKELINHLAVVNMANTGVTFHNMEEALILSSNSSNIETFQRIGRMLMPRENYIAKINVLCAKDTIEEIWLEKALVDVPKERIKVIDL